MRDENTSDRKGDLGLLMRWGGFVVVLVIGGLLLASRATDAYTTAFGFLLMGFGVLLAFRLIVRVTP